MYPKVFELRKERVYVRFKVHCLKEKSIITLVNSSLSYSGKQISKFQGYCFVRFHE